MEIEEDNSTYNGTCTDIYNMGWSVESKFGMKKIGKIEDFELRFLTNRVPS